MKKNKLITSVVIILIVVGVFLGGRLWYYLKYEKRTPLNDLFPEADQMYENNKESFQIIADSFEGKYDIYDLPADKKFSSGSDILTGLYYTTSNHLTMTNNNEIDDCIHTFGSSSQGNYFNFTQEQIDAFEHVLKDLEFIEIYYYLYKDGRYYIFFGKGLYEYETPPWQMEKDIVSYGISFSSDAKNAPEEVGYFNHDEHLSDNNWFKAYMGCGV